MALLRAHKFLALVFLLWSSVASAQPEVDALRVYVGAPGSICAIHSGTGTPSTSLGAVCDVYVRKDSPYTVYTKTGASQWVMISAGPYTTGDLIYSSSSTDLGKLSSVATGQVLVSGGVGVAPSYSATPTVSTLTATTQETSVWLDNANPGLMFRETDQGVDSKVWQVKANNAGWRMRLINDAITVANPFFQAERTGMGVTSVTISPDAGDIILAPGGLDILPDTGYTKNLGSLTTKYLTLHAAELWVETLVAQNTIATIGGRILVGPTTTLTADLLAAATTMSVKHNQMVSGARVVLQANGSLEWIAVTSGPSGVGPYTYSITRDLDGTGANNWSAGDAVFNTGTTGNGFIDLYSVAGVIPGSTAGPTIVGNVRTGTTYSQVAPRWSIGNLNGICGYATEIYGATFGDCSATNVTIDATNGFRIRSGTTNKLLADTSGNLSIVGDLSVGTAGLIRSGATSYASGTGYVLDYNSGTPRLRVGTTSGNRLAWDGTDLTLVSANATIGPSGVAITPSTTTATARSYGFTVATGSLGLFGTDAGGADLGRSVFLQSEWTGSGDYPNDVLAYLRARHFKSGGTDRDTFIRLRSTETAGSIYMQAISGTVVMNTATVQTNADFAVISDSEFHFTTGIQFTADTAVPSGGIAQTSGDGLTLKAVSGSTRDFTVLSTGGVAVIGVSGTEVGLAGVSGDGTGKVLCVKSDASIGTCNASSIGASTCTCS